MPQSFLKLWRADSLWNEKNVHMADGNSVGGRKKEKKEILCEKVLRQFSCWRRWQDEFIPAQPSLVDLQTLKKLFRMCNVCDFPTLMSPLMSQQNLLPSSSAFGSTEHCQRQVLHLSKLDGRFLNCRCIPSFISNRDYFQKMISFH